MTLQQLRYTAAPAHRHHRLCRGHSPAGAERHPADFRHLGCKRCILPLWGQDWSCSWRSLQGGRHQRRRRHLLWSSSVQALQGGAGHPDCGQAGKHSGLCQQSGQHHHQPPWGNSGDAYIGRSRKIIEPAIDLYQMTQAGGREPWAGRCIAKRRIFCFSGSER